MSYFAGEVKPSKVKCCVPNCNDYYSPRFRFPLPRNTDMVQQWLRNINNPLLNDISYEELYEKFRICSRHFLAQYIRGDCTRSRGVTYNAVPTLFLPAPEPVEHYENALESPSPIKKLKLDIRNMHTEEKSFKEHVSISEIYDIEKGQKCMPSTSADVTKMKVVGEESHEASHSTIEAVPSRSTYTPDLRKSSNQTRKLLSPITVKLFDGHKKQSHILKEIFVTRQKCLTPKAKHLYKRVIESSNKLGRLSKKLSSFRARLISAENLALSPTFEGLIDHVNTLTYKFILSQVRTQQQRPKARRFSLDEKLLALTILKASGKGYRLLSKIFTLPSRQTLTNLLNKIPFGPGLNKCIFDTMEKSIKKMKALDRYAILLFDEMSIESLVTYDSKEDNIKGLEDFGKDKRKAELADHVNVFMVKGLFRQWKQPICYTFSGGATKSQPLKVLIKEIIQECHRIGFEILATVCDQGSTNQAAINQLLQYIHDFCP